MQDLRTDPAVWQKKGYGKIQQTCQQAPDDGLSYVWVDTCCIDKGNSAKLSELTNSMFSCYQQARLCYIFLDDVEAELRAPHAGSHLQPADGLTDQGSFLGSRWFTCGWTLQELLAAHFYNAIRGFIGTRATTAELIFKATGIGFEYLRSRYSQYSHSIGAASIAQRMSWASQRLTTRPEDTVCSLLGIFDVNMPLLYGEGGKKAFLRLQLVIMEKSSDESLFAWSLEPPTNLPEPGRLPLERNFTGMLADQPAAFYYSRHVARTSGISNSTWPSFSATNRGISFYCAPTADDYIMTILAGSNHPGLEVGLDCEASNISGAKPDRSTISLRVRLCSNGTYYRVGIHSSERTWLFKAWHRVLRAQRHIYTAAAANGTEEAASGTGYLAGIIACMGGDPYHRESGSKGLSYVFTVSLGIALALYFGCVAILYEVGERYSVIVPCLIILIKDLLPISTFWTLIWTLVIFAFRHRHDSV